MAKVGRPQSKDKDGNIILKAPRNINLDIEILEKLGKLNMNVSALTNKLLRKFLEDIGELEKKD
jgi:post-segregation antitoxin (ccd killing protein)